MRKSRSASGSRAFSSRYCCIIGVDDDSLMAFEGTKGATVADERGSAIPGAASRRDAARTMDVTARPAPIRPVPIRSELVEGRLFLGVDLEDLVEPGDPEDLEQVGVDAAELELPLHRTDLLLEIDQLAQRGTGEVLHVAEVQQELLMTLVFHKAIELVTDLLNVLFRHDLGIDEADHGYPVDGLEAEMAARGLRHRADSCPGSEPYPNRSRETGYDKCGTASGASRA